MKNEKLRLGAAGDDRNKMEAAIGESIKHTHLTSEFIGMLYLKNIAHGPNAIPPGK